MFCGKFGGVAKTGVVVVAGGGGIGGGCCWKAPAVAGGVSGGGARRGICCRGMSLFNLLLFLLKPYHFVRWQA